MRRSILVRQTSIGDKIFDADFYTIMNSVGFDTSYRDAITIQSAIDIHNSRKYKKDFWGSVEDGKKKNKGPTSSV